jgi:hypothetical protein
MSAKSVIALFVGWILTIGAPAVAQTGEQVNERFLAACMVSAEFDDPLGAEARHHSYCRCRLDALNGAYTRDQIEQISAYIEEGNGGVEPRAVPLVGIDLAANESAASTCRSRLNDQ